MARRRRFPLSIGVTTNVTEMDALVAYLQVLGQLTKAAYENTAAPEKMPDPNN